MARYEETLKLDEVVSKVDTIIAEIQKIKEGNVMKVYNTKELSKYLGIGKSVIDKMRQNGEITYSKMGQTFLFTQQDVDDWFKRNKIKYVV